MIAGINMDKYKGNYDPNLKQRLFGEISSLRGIDAFLPEHARISQARTPHQILGVRVGATRKEVLNAYRSICKLVHPDMIGEYFRELSEETFRKVNMAYQALS